MTKLELQIHDDIVSTINKMRNINDTGIELVIPENAVLFESIVNLKIIQSFADNLGLNVIFTTQDEIGNNLISMLDGNANINDFVETISGDITESTTASSKKFALKMPKLSFKPHIPRFSIKGFVLIPVFLLILGGVYFWINSTRGAYAKITVESQALTRSLTIKVKTNAETSSEQKILKGYAITAEADEVTDIETTGEKTVGEKAEGKALIYNKTTDEKEFKKGTTLVYDRDTGDLNFLTTDGVTIPAAEPEDPLDPASSLKPGSVEVDIIAENVGGDYNLAKDKSLEVKGQKKVDFTAKVSEELSGGKSEKIKVVAQADMDALREKIKKLAQDSATNALKRNVKGGQAFIDGSTTTKVEKETFSHKLDEKTDKLSLTQTVSATGLVYQKDDLNKLTDQLVTDLIPDGFELSNKEREVKVEVLGNSTNTTLSSTEADIQVTLKTYIVYKINEDELKERLKGKSFSDGEKIVGSISNIKTYEFNINPNIPFFNKVPNDPSKITLEIIRE